MYVYMYVRVHDLYVCMICMHNLCLYVCVCMYACGHDPYVCMICVIIMVYQGKFYAYVCIYMCVYMNICMICVYV